MDIAQRIMGSAAVVLGSILVAASVCFASVALVRMASGQVGFVCSGVNNRVREDIE